MLKYLHNSAIVKKLKSNGKRKDEQTPENVLKFFDDYFTDHPLSKYELKAKRTASYP